MPFTTSSLWGVIFLFLTTTGALPILGSIQEESLVAVFLRGGNPSSDMGAKLISPSISPRLSRAVSPLLEYVHSTLDPSVLRQRQTVTHVKRATPPQGSETRSSIPDSERNAYVNPGVNGVTNGVNSNGIYGSASIVGSAPSSPRIDSSPPLSRVQSPSASLRGNVANGNGNGNGMYSPSVGGAPSSPRIDSAPSTSTNSHIEDGPEEEDDEPRPDGYDGESYSMGIDRIGSSG